MTFVNSIPADVPCSLAAQLAGVSVRSVYSWIERGWLTPIGKPARIAVSELEKLLGRSFDDTEIAKAAAQRQAHLATNRSRRADREITRAIPLTLQGPAPRTRHSNQLGQSDDYRFVTSN